MSAAPEQLLDQYLDGLLTSEQREAFKQTVASDSALRTQVELQSMMDATIRSIFAPPESNALGVFSKAHSEHNGRAPDQAPIPIIRPSKQTGRRQFLMAAAAVAIAVTATWRTYTFLNPPKVFDAYGPQPWRSLETVYQDKIAEGFVVDWECKDDEEFARTFKRRFGQPLLLTATLPRNVVSLGLGYCNSISPNTVYLLSRVDGKEVVVFIDELARDSKLPAPKSHSLNVFRRELGKLVLYEFTPHLEPHMLSLFFNPDDR